MPGLRPAIQNRSSFHLSYSSNSSSHFYNCFLIWSPFKLATRSLISGKDLGCLEAPKHRVQDFVPRSPTQCYQHLRGAGIRHVAHPGECSRFALSPGRFRPEPVRWLFVGDRVRLRGADLPHHHGDDGNRVRRHQRRSERSSACCSGIEFLVCADCHNRSSTAGRADHEVELNQPACAGHQSTDPARPLTRTLPAKRLGQSATQLMAK